MPRKKAVPVRKKGKEKSGDDVVEKGFKFSNRTRKRMAKAKKGRKLSQETKDKISAARRERQLLVDNGFLPAFTHSQETKDHLSKVMKRKKHKPTRKAIRNSAANRSSEADAKKIARKFSRGKV